MKQAITTLGSIKNNDVVLHSSKVSCINIALCFLLPAVLETVNVLEALLLFFFTMMLFTVYASIFHGWVVQKILKTKKGRLNNALIGVGYSLKQWNYVIPALYSLCFIFFQLEYIAINV